MKSAKRFISFLLIATAFAASLSSCADGEHVCAFDVTETVKAATCTESGELARKCSVCGKSETFALAPTSHILGDLEKNGFHYSKICTLCGTDLVDLKLDTAYSEGLEYDRELRSDHYTLKSIGNCEDSVIVIPSELKGTPVTAIANSAFAGCKNIKIVIIPDTVTSIGSNAFSNCRQLIEVVLPNSLTNLGTCVFSNTPNLKEIVIPPSLTVLPKLSFANSSIESLAIPSGITKISTSAFKDCGDLKRISLPDTLTEIDSEAFADCRSLTNVVLPDSITFIGESAFAGCTSLRSAIIPKGVSTLSAKIFNDCTSLEKIYLHEELRSIHGTSLLGVNIRSLELLIPSGNDYLYHDGSSLIGRDPDAIKVGSMLVKAHPDTVIIGSADGSIPTDEKIKKIGACAFQGRSDLTHIVIPKNITSIGGGAFHDCPNIISIRYEGTVAEWKEISLGVKWYTGYQVATVKCSDGGVKIEFD